jgi:RNA polymerase III subunit RPC82 helix-turn-helix domain
VVGGAFAVGLASHLHLVQNRAQRDSAPVAHLMQPQSLQVHAQVCAAFLTVTLLAQDVCRHLLDRGPCTLREAVAGTGLARRHVCRALLALVQHSFVAALLREELVASGTLITATVYKARRPPGLHLFESNIDA